MPMLKTALAIATALFLSLGLLPDSPTAKAAGEPLPTVASVDLQRYVGTWYEIGRLPNVFQRQCLSDTTAQYAARPDGNIDVTNRCRTAGKGDSEWETARGLARIIDPVSKARLQVSFLPEALRWLPIGWGDYWVLELDADYRWVMVGEPGLRYLWVLSRTPALPPGTLESLLARARALGFPVEQMMLTLQSATAR
jgi:apolipoprotein D and lipocalin family protein